MKKYIVSAAGILFILLSCLPLHAAEPRFFRVGAFNYYPAIFKDKDGAVKGFYVDALADIGQRENIRFEYVYGTWAEGMERIKTGEVDVLVSVAFTEERAKFLDYAETPLLTVWAELYTTVGSGIDGIFEVKGKKIAVMKNDYNAKNFINLVKSFNIACELVEEPDSDAVLNAVASKKADAGIVNSTFGAAKQKEYGLHSTGVVFNPFDIFFAVAKDKNQALLALLESNLADWRLQPDSPYDKARQKWLHRNDPITVIPSWVVIALIVTGISAMVPVAFVLALKQQVKRKTISLMESAEQYKILAARQEAILTSVPDIIMEVNANKIYTWANAAGFEFFGDDVIGKQASYYFEGEQNTYKGVHLSFDKLEDLLYLEGLQRRRDGEVRLLAWWCKTLVDDQGIVTGTLSTARDITEQKHAEESLRKSEERFLLAMKASNDGLFDWNLETNDIYYSPAWKKILGYEDHELANDFSIWENTTDPEDVKKSWELQQKLISKQIDRFVVEFKMKHKDGHWVDILSRAEAFFNDKGKAIRIVGTHVDITEQKLAEANLKMAHEKMLTILDSIDSTVYVADRDTYEILFMNKKMITDFGGDKTGEKCFRAFRNGSKPCGFCNNDRLVDAGGRPAGVLIWHDQNKTTGKYYINHDRAIEWTDGRLVRVQFATDITDIKNMEARLNQVQKMESIGTLAGGIAHDFNNILFPIVGHTEMLMEDISEDGPVRSSLNEIYAGALRARDLVQQILSFSRQGEAELHMMKLQPIVKEALKLIRATIPTSISMVQNIQPGCGAVTADPTHIHQIVMNLTTNAYHAMEESGGELKVSLEQIELDRPNPVYPDMPPGPYACLSVADTGPGIPREIRDRIFEPFFTTKEKGKGTGMGLSVVHGIVKTMNGAVQVSSEPGRGTEFRVYLPVVGQGAEKKESPACEALPGGSEKVLLVDDEEAIITMERQMLKRLGYDVTSCTGSMEALDTFRAGPDQFDLVITDMAMPNLSGDKLAAELIRIRPDIPILLCTGFSETLTEERIESLGIRGLVLKPIIMKDLALKIRKILDGDKNAK